ncbi:hypothetical protein [Hyphomicrobium sp.]|uniref:hypothetical protein n=1 Tax=Hyphomicrobium sp. TaxID=82 RepID=UPI002D7896CA|nr:hypothetical protein [Hyphomicrobium sp.]HET6389600.1 hypothetical protein [Hyphomicrobium sp.]
MVPHRRFSGVAAAALLLAAACFSLTFRADGAYANEAAEKCEGEIGFSMLASPAAPWKGAPLRVVFTSEHPISAELTLTSPDGAVAVTSRDRHGGPPYFWFAEVAAPAAGTWRAKLTHDGSGQDCANITREIAVARTASTPVRATGKSVWPLRAQWNRENEDLYSAWIEKLFDAPIDQELSWPALHEVLRDKSRNFLFNHLGLGEDEKKLVIKPDCADLPYFLRAYFAFKLGLPFGYSKCSRGGSGKAPRCPQWFNIQREEVPSSTKDESGGSTSILAAFGATAAPAASAKTSSRPQGLVPGFGYYLRTTVANGVHSGSARTAAEDDNTDYYPVPLKAETLRPGTIYADPYGHVLVLVKRIAQTPDSAGVFLAVDGQPDGTVARKRFWRGNFLFAQNPSLGSPGFKRFRPIMADAKGGLRRLTNAEISKSAEYGDFSLEQAKLSVEDFYDRMDDVMSPEALDPMRAMRETITALEEQIKTRVTSVENGRKYQVKGGAEVAMPAGSSIFETTGAWEDYATPSRDLRLLIAIDVVRGFPDRVVRRADRYAMPKDKSPEQVKVELESTLASELASRKFSYPRSDGSPWTLAMKDIVDRAADLEMAYNVNDCVELRWGAPEKSDEAATCKRRAPSAQRTRMAEYRSWFHDRRRPARGE